MATLGPQLGKANGPFRDLEKLVFGFTLSIFCIIKNFCTSQAPNDAHLSSQAMQEAEIRRIAVHGQPAQEDGKIPSQPEKSEHGAECLSSQP
jgi:hypothetical protein